MSAILRTCNIVNGEDIVQRSMSIRDSEWAAIEIALDELISYVDVVGDEGDLDEEEMPSGKLRWAISKIEELLKRRDLS